jgi:hypothetical protein
VIPNYTYKISLNYYFLSAQVLNIISLTAMSEIKGLPMKENQLVFFFARARKTK